MCEQSLKQLHVPDTMSLNQAVLRLLPCGLEVALLAVAFDDACVDHGDGKSYSFPAFMPNLKHLRLQVCPLHAAAPFDPQNAAIFTGHPGLWAICRPLLQETFCSALQA
jgi:hypothetical protein